MKKYLYDGKHIRELDMDTGKQHYLMIGMRVEIAEEPTGENKVHNIGIPTQVLLAFIQSYPAFTIFECSLLLEGNLRSSHILQWNGKNTLQDEMHGGIRSVAIKDFYPNEGFWVITSITTQEDMYAN